ncbi:MAG: bifunctional diaminohydroxyphosphoribosylaminopyrimidine deaminase/5-amino-6-(5-phosphoribosylamino)uracil reductase RibD [Chloroflexota bacterium]|nr:bifunctional diaminohydroxyphosphoribosylaminopyrimidine deaminase/5-amino-6-(5-phosphoribosylamino)uracil reductase RibD [Chloroflexota bacterium]
MATTNYMDLALDLARARLGQVSPLPAVGAVVARDGRVAGQAATAAAPGLHAERRALDRAGDAAWGADIYVTLEPCDHQGATPPCTEAILQAGIARVFVAVRDPNPVAWGGAQTLRATGIAVDVGMGGEVANAMYQGFFKWAKQKRPYVIAKWAMSKDGKISGVGGERRQISGEESGRRVHEMRRRADAILVGGATAINDDPLLTCRLDGYAGSQPLRVVLDRRLRLPATARMLGKNVPGATLVVTGPGAAAGRMAELEAAGAEVLVLDEAPDNQLPGLLDELGRRGALELLVEGGAGVLGAFLDAGLVDRVEAFVAPFEMGAGVAAPVTGTAAADFASIGPVGAVSLRDSGEDVQITAIASVYGPGAESA